MATTNVQKFAGDVDAKGAVVTRAVSYDVSQDAPYLIAGSTSYTGESTNWGTYGIQHRLKTNSGGVPRVTIDTQYSGESFCVTNDGKVGINTDSPNSKFEVKGTGGIFSVDPDTADFVKIGNFAASGDTLHVGSLGDVVIGSDANNNSTGKNIDFRTNTETNGGTLLMRLQDDGNVGINDASPYNKLSVVGKATVGGGAGTGTAAYHAGTLNVIGGGSRAILQIENNSSVGSPALIFGEGGVFTEDTVPTIKKKQGTNDLLIKSSGTVGIGTDTPDSSYKLDVNGTGRATNFYMDYYLRHHGNVGAFLGFPFNDTIGFGTATYWRMWINSSGNVGINNTNPGAKLTVSGAGNATIGTNWATYLSAGYRAWVNRGQYNIGANIGIWASKDIITQGNLWSHRSGLSTSDRRIKQDITDIEDDSALEQIRLLQPKRYKYIDYHTNGGTDEKVMGFIAQEVANVIPEAISIKTQYIPNIYGLSFIESDDVVRFETFDINDFQSEEPIKIKFCSEEDTDIEATITEIIDNHTVRVEIDQTEKYSNLYDAGIDVADENGEFSRMVFVYGEQVNDFHTLRKDAIWTATTAALQEVDRQLQSEKTKVEILETQVADLITRVTNLEAAT